MRTHEVIPRAGPLRMQPIAHSLPSIQTQGVHLHPARVYASRSHARTKPDPNARMRTHAPSLYPLLLRGSEANASAHARTRNFQFTAAFNVLYALDATIHVACSDLYDVYGILHFTSYPAIPNTADYD
eukprot:5481648-Pleurochrysis_carterae.AAC.3